MPVTNFQNFSYCGLTNLGDKWLLSIYPYSVNIVTVTVIILFIFFRHVSNKNFSHLFCICKNALVKFNEIEQQDAECSECEIVIKDSVN